MACSSLIIWRPVPVGSRFVPRTSGDESAYNVTVFVTRNGEAATPLRHDAIAAGTAEVTFAENDQYVFDVVLPVLHTPTQNVGLDLRIVDANDVVVQVSDGSGGERLASCSSAFDTAATMTFKVIARA